MNRKCALFMHGDWLRNEPCAQEQRTLLFNSLAFLAFLPTVFAGYWLTASPKGEDYVSPVRLHLQNLFVVLASYVFYGWWDWKFLLLITFTSLWAWASGLAIERFPAKGRLTVAFTLVVNLGILGVFKYFNFFLDNAVALLHALGFAAHPSSLKVILPVGISFYTFQALSYVLDIRRGTVKATRDLVAFLAYVSFFPLLVAGPIERATNLLPQFLKPRRFDHALAVEGCRQMAWGFFKKVLVADTCARAANALLGNPHPSSVSLWAGSFAFAFQIYGDFSGYSDIAIGCSKLFGIRAMRNFAQPYFARDVAEFWHRWHISLTTWFRDYLYIPLGGSRCGTWKKVRNTFAVFLVSGLWHGANWTFLAWGAFHAVCFLPLLLRGANRRHVTDCVAEGHLLPSVREVAETLATFALVIVGWTLFRAPDFATAGAWLAKMLSFSDGTVRQVGLGWMASVAFAVVPLVLVEWFSRGRDVPRLPQGKAMRWLVYGAFTAFILWNRPEPQAFIYFQF